MQKALDLWKVNQHPEKLAAIQPIKGGSLRVFDGLVAHSMGVACRSDRNWGRIGGSEDANSHLAEPKLRPAVT